MYDLVIIGGGVWGTSAALAAVEQHMGKVLLVESNPYVAGESSAKAGGIVSDFVAHSDDQVWVAKSRELFLRAQAVSGDSTMIQKNGMISLCTPEEFHALQSQTQSLRDRGIPVEVWDANEARHHYPDLDGISPETMAIWTPEDWHVNPTAYAQAVVGLARNCGLDVRMSCRISAIRVESHSVVLECPDGPIHADRVLVAAGTWTRKLVRTAGSDIPFLPYRTQLASLDFPGGCHLPIVRELSSDIYLVPDGAHNLLTGDGTRLWEHDPDDYQTTGDDEFEADIATGVMRLMLSKGGTAQLRRSWAGLCGATPDRRPLIGSVLDRLYIACGDNGFGIKRGPAIGELAVQMAMGTADAVPHLDPHRFPPVDFPLRPGSGGTFNN